MLKGTFEEISRQIGLTAEISYQPVIENKGKKKIASVKVPSYSGLKTGLCRALLDVLLPGSVVLEVVYVIWEQHAHPYLFSLAVHHEVIPTDSTTDPITMYFPSRKGIGLNRCCISACPFPMNVSSWRNPKISPAFFRTTNLSTSIRSAEIEALLAKPLSRWGNGQRLIHPHDRDEATARQKLHIPY